MGFFDKIKQFFGIGTVSAKLNVTPATFKATDSEIKGTLVITGKSDQDIESVEVKFEEKWSKGKDDDKQEKTFTLGTFKMNQPFSIKKDEVKTIEFAIPFEMVKSDNDKLKEKGGVLGGLGKMGSFLDNEKSDFELVATVDVKGATFDPNDILSMKKIA